MTLFHYTCDHGRTALGEGGLLRPAGQLTDRPLPWTGEFVWLTDLAHPNADALGLTRTLAPCDRTRHRYRVTDVRDVVPWTDAAHRLARPIREEIEGEPGSRPRHWFVSVVPVPAIYDPIP